MQTSLSCRLSLLQHHPQPTSLTKTTIENDADIQNHNQHHHYGDDEFLENE
jgi:hypothetical protein